MSTALLTVTNGRFVALPRVAPLAVFITLLCVTSLAGSHRLETAKGLRLELSDEGCVAGISIGTGVLPLRGTGGLACPGHGPTVAGLETQDFSSTNGRKLWEVKCLPRPRVV